MNPTIRKSESIATLAGALVKAQAELKNPPKDSVNPHFKSKYADLATVRDTVTPVLTRHGLAVLQVPCETEGGPALVTLLAHTSGEWVETLMLLRAQQQTPQGVGSALTYARRYALQSLAGVAADEDDDGQAASQPAKEKRRADPPPAEAEHVTPGDPVTDHTAMVELLRAKGFGWADLIDSLNKRHKLSLSVNRTRWLDVPREARADAVARLKKLPDKATDTPDSVAELVRSWASLTGTTFDAAMWVSLAKAEAQDCSCLDDCTPAQLTAAAKFLREQIEKKKGGAA